MTAPDVERGMSDDRIEGTLLGTAYGDALGLAVEGMSAKAIARRFGAVERFHLLGRKGFVSDDTEQSALVAQSLARHPDDLDALAARGFRRALLEWFLRLPWGVGLATVRACVRIALGLRRSGVQSAGNGAAMRAAVIGAAIDDPAQRRAWSDRFAEVTHTDPRAVQGARPSSPRSPPSPASRSASPRDRAGARMAVMDHPSLVTAARRSRPRRARRPPSTRSRASGTPASWCTPRPRDLDAFARWGADPLRAVRGVIAFGGDTDSIATIVGAWCGARHGTAWIPQDHLAAMRDGLRPDAPARWPGTSPSAAGSPRGTARSRRWPATSRSTPWCSPTGFAA